MSAGPPLVENNPQPVVCDPFPKFFVHSDSKQIFYRFWDVEYRPFLPINVVGVDDEVSQFVQFQALIIFNFDQSLYSSWSSYCDTDMCLLHVLDMFREFEMSCKELCDVSLARVSILFESSFLGLDPQNIGIPSQISDSQSSWGNN